MFALLSRLFPATAGSLAEALARGTGRVSALSCAALPALALAAEEESNSMFDLPAPFLAGLIVVLLLSLSWHEAAHAYVADRLGDPTARMLGRVTLNPLKHLDPFLSVLLPAMLLMAGSPFVIGGGKPVPIDVRNFRHKARDFMLVALAGPGSNLLLAAAFGLLFLFCVWAGIFPVEWIPNPYGKPTPLPPTMDLLHSGEVANPSLFWVQIGALINIGLAMFNLMPIPPLDGSRLIGWLLPRPLQPRWYALDRIGLLLVVVVFFLLGGIKYVQIGFVYLATHYAAAVDRLAWTLVGA